MAAVSNDSSTSDSSSCYLRGRRHSSSLASSFYPSHYYSQDRVHLLRIAVVTVMGFLTLLVVTLLLHEAVLADQRIVNSPLKHKLIDKFKVEKAIRGIALSEAKGEAFTPRPSSKTMPPQTTTEDAAEALPPLPMRYSMDDAQFRRWRDSYRKRRKSHKRNGNSGPYRVGMPLPKDSYDPFNFGEEQYERAPSNPGPKYSYPNDAKSIQEIIKFLTDNKVRGRFPSNGLRLKGKVKNLDMNDPVKDMFPQEMRHETKYASTNPLEDFRMAGDPKEVNNVLMGFSPTRSSYKGSSSDVKPKTVSLMLDIHPMGGVSVGGRHVDEASASSVSGTRSRRPPPKRKYRRNRPRDNDEPYYRDYYHARPSYNHETTRPYLRGERETYGADKHHQIMLHLNFFPSHKKKNDNDVDLSPSASKPVGLSDLAPSPRDVDMRPPSKAENAPPFKAEQIPNILNDPSINVFNRHRYNAAQTVNNMGAPVPSSQVAFDAAADSENSLFHDMKNHRLTPVDVGPLSPQHSYAAYQELVAAGLESSSHLTHPTYPLTGLTYGLPVHRFIADDSMIDHGTPEPRDNTLKV